ncbi:MAG TPA: class I SAM-dependent methyltransferase [Blastocatellia bacterium]|nr:class I SAM-dependent methyltransferase [Blastocatellia bacterium]
MSKSPVYHRRETCRACGENSLKLFLPLGAQPLANSFLKSPDEFAEEQFFPLDTHFCETCSLVQIPDVVDPEVLFRHYLYVTGTSETIAQHNRAYAKSVTEMQRLTADDLVIEVASNDGSLLRCFQELGVKTLGIDPATNVAAMARANGVETINEFFSLETAQKVRAEYGPAKAVIGNNVLAHVDDTQDFLRGCKAVIGENGLVIIEMPYLGDLLNRTEYDTIYHEHLCYFSVTSLMRLCESAGLRIVRMDHVPIHGGSLRMHAGHAEVYQTHSAQVLDWAEEEKSKGFTSFERFEQLARSVERSRESLLDLLNRLKAEGKTVAGYGAAAKGNTLLNYCQIGTDLLPYVVDKNPLKLGMFTPGMHIPVLPVSTLLERQPDYLLILAWNFGEEIMRQQSEYKARGGKFILPVPEVTVV